MKLNNKYLIEVTNRSKFYWEKLIEEKDAGIYKRKKERKTINL